MKRRLTWPGAALAGYLACLASTVALAAAPAEDTEPDVSVEVEELVVYGRAQRLIERANSASEGIVGYDDIRLPPMLRVGELVEAVPGMVATQHSGTGKANQYFIRGFNLDHGTDFAVAVEGVPVNLRSHGHGQGYLDLNFLIPELVETTRYRRGPYSAEVGDFSSAASVQFDLYDRLDEAVLSATVGEYGYQRALAAGSGEAGGGVLTAALDFTQYEGPWDLDEDLEQLKLFGAYTGSLAGADLRITLQGYDSDWNASDQIPARAVRAGLIGPLGNIDDDLGGETSRYALTGSLDFAAWSVNAYAVDYDFRLYSNFTYFLDDPLAGDQFEQRDVRRVYGLGVRGGGDAPQPASRVVLRWGGDLRFDDIDEVGLYGTENRVRIDTVRDDRVQELSAAAWGEAEWLLADRLRASLGLRADWYDWDVRAVRDANSGSGDDTILSPKAGIAWRFADRAEAYLNAGRGFHSNDVRGATITVDPVSAGAVDAVPALVRSDGAELGLRIENGQSFNATLTMFWLELDSELVYVGDAGTTEANDATERFGVEGALFWQATDWLALNSAYTTTDARFKTDQDGGREIPGAVESTFTLGLNAAWENGLSASARLRWLSEAPLVEDNSIRSDDSMLVNAGVAYRTGGVEFRLDVFNLFDSDDNDIAYRYASRLPGEPLAGVEDIHFHPLEARSVRGSVTWLWD
ncbi:MAG: TonB-dependent receptor [Pseudomonadota bacterium]